MELFKSWFGMIGMDAGTSTVIIMLSLLFFAMGAAAQLCAVKRAGRIAIPVVLACLLILAIVLLKSKSFLFSIMGVFLGGADECALAGALAIELLRLVRRK